MVENTNPALDFRTGQIPLLVSFPHSGIGIPSDIAARMTPAGLTVPDTDWDLPRLYDFEEVHRASQIRAIFSRYVIDPNRPPDGSNLYPGQPTPELCPTHTFDGRKIYFDGQEPTPRDVESRMESYWIPYHRTLRTELTRLRDHFGIAVLFDAHSIASQVPRLFDGTLPDLNLGTARGESSAPSLETAIRDDLADQAVYTSVINGRFIGGYITRNFGQPAENIHAVQLELSQATYMDESSASWDDNRASRIRPVLQSILATIVQWITNPS